MNKEALSADQVDEAALDEFKREQVNHDKVAPHHHIISPNLGGAPWGG